ncbi:MAG: histidine ammonia-lyase [Deltaproteobacteria bacterium]|nr:histidine ammonia-lyase [Deltaproteobacteria bacterium]
MKTGQFNLGKDHLDARTLVSLSRQANPPVQVDRESLKRVIERRTFIENALNGGKTIYGVNTGFGFLSKVKIPREKACELQVNLIRSHASGVGGNVDDDVVRGMLILKAHNLLSGLSGVSSACVEHLVSFLRKGILPRVPRQGSVGASGDLAPLAHLALALIGEGKSVYDGRELATADLLKRLGVTPYKPQAKEGLSLINGTQYMAVEGCFAVEEAFQLIHVADLALAMSLAGFGGTLAAFDARIHAARPHKGQIEVAAHIRSLFEASDELYYRHQDYSRVQDPYSFRCAPQVHGVARDTWAFTKGVVDTELNGVTDNPLVFEDEVISGGNFHGEPLACAFDFLTIAIAELGNISERRIEKLSNPGMSGLPAFLVKNEGLQSGFMIPQVVAASLVSENKTLSHPASVDSIPTSAEKEDHVSMGPFAAQKLRTVCKNLAKILAIEFLAASQAIDLRQPRSLSAKLKRLHDTIRGISPFLENDRSLGSEIEQLADKILRGDFESC